VSTEQNKALARQFVQEIFGRGNVGAADDFLARDFVEHEELPGGLPRDREGVKQLATMVRRAFPDLIVTIDDIVAEGDKVVIRQTWRGTQKGDFMGVPPTGKTISVGVIDIIGMAGGKCVEHWGQMDAMGLMQQLGALPMPGQNR
jgi:steroid delta-isomerase-like uncharacterized protein